MADLLRTFQMLWLAFVVGIGALTAIALAVAEVETTVPTVLPLVLLVTVGAGATAGVVAVDRGLQMSRPDSDVAALVEFRSRFFMQVAMLEFVPLLAFAMAFAMGPAWIMAVGALAVLPAFLRIRPSARRIRMFDHTWQAAGHPVSIERGAQGGSEEASP